jgi:predicted Zn-dependent protease
VKNLILSLLIVTLLLGLRSPVSAQGCSMPEVFPNSKIYNIFSPEQETIFGELTFQHMAGDLRLIRDPELVAYVENIGQRLAKHLPPVGLKFRFFIIDLSEANAFNNSVYVRCRKTYAQSDSSHELRPEAS